MRNAVAVLLTDHLRPKMLRSLKINRPSCTAGVHGMVWLDSLLATDGPKG